MDWNQNSKKTHPKNYTYVEILAIYDFYTFYINFTLTIEFNIIV